MSVIVKGMEMPKNCRICPCFQYDMFDDDIDGYCKALKTKIMNRSKHHPDCPLIELPPHGRLGDLDKLNIHDISPVDGFCVMGVTEEDIELADTVIEAEGETDA